MRQAGFRIEDIPTSFTVLSASRDTIPHVGYFETDVEALGHLVPGRVVPVTRDITASEHSHIASGSLGMKTLQEYWEHLIKKGQDYLQWPDPNTWQKAFKAVNNRIELSQARDDIGTARLRQVGIKCCDIRRSCGAWSTKYNWNKWGAIWSASIEQGKCSALPVGIAIQPCFVRIEKWRFPILLCDKKDEIPKGVQLDALYGNASVVREV